MRGTNPVVAFCAAGVLFSLAPEIIALSLTGAQAQQQRAQPPSSIPEVLPLGQIERALLESINTERAARKLPLVRLSPALADLARKQSEDMAKLGRLEHVSASGKSYTERLVEAGFFFAANGENVACSDSFQPGPIHEVLMRSEGHRENILQPSFDEVGVGVILGSDGLYYVTQDFIQSLTIRDEESIRATVLALFDESRRSRGLAPLLVVDEVQRKAKLFAQLKSEGKELPAVPMEFGETRVDFYTGPDLGKISAAIKASSLERYQMTGIGACFVRTPHFSGGGYYICIFLLASDPAFQWSEEDRVRAVLRALNRLRSDRAMGPLELDAGLNRAAGRIGPRYQKSKAGVSVPGGRAVAVIYETNVLGNVAPGLYARIANKDFRKVGISVIPSAAGARLNVNLLVVLLLHD